MQLTMRDRLDRWVGDSLPVHRATTPNLSVLNPMFAEAGLIDPKTGRKVPGLYIGQCGRDGIGGNFWYDPFELYRAGLINNLNAVVLGEINHRKSTLIKSLIYGACAVGYNCMAIDPKGEYELLVDAIPGAKTLEFGSGSAHINPLDPLIPDDAQLDLLASLALITMADGRLGLGVEEHSLLDEAVQAAKTAAKECDKVTTLSWVIERLFNPTDTMVKRLQGSADYLKDQARPMALGLRRLTEGDLQGGLDQETTKDLVQDTPFLRIKCQDLNTDKTAINITLINYFTSAQYGKDSPWGRFHWVFHDEAWDLAKHSAYVHSLRQSFKLGRSQGISVWIVMHHLQNLYRSGHHEAVKDLIGDTDTRIIYQQNAHNIEASAQELELNPALLSVVTQLTPGNAIWNIGQQPGLPVKHIVWPELLPVVETSHLIKGQTK